MNRLFDGDAPPLFQEGYRKRRPAVAAELRPPRGRPSRAQSERRNQELLDRALDLFLERGFERTTIEAIIDSIGMARKTVYARYGDKLTLFKAALQGAIDELVVPAERLREIEKPDLHETLLTVATLVLHNMCSESGERLMRLAQAELFRLPQILNYLLSQTVQVTVGYLTDLFERRDLETPSESALSCYLLVINGSYQAQSWFGTSAENFDRQLSARVRLFLNGAQAKRAPGHTGSHEEKPPLEMRSSGPA